MLLDVLMSVCRTINLLSVVFMDVVILVSISNMKFVPKVLDRMNTNLLFYAKKIRMIIFKTKSNN